MGGWAITGAVGGTEKETETTLTSQVANPGIDHKGGWVGERKLSRRGIVSVTRKGEGLLIGVQKLRFDEWLWKPPLTR